MFPLLRSKKRKHKKDKGETQEIRDLVDEDAVQHGQLLLVDFVGLAVEVFIFATCQLH